MPTREPTPEQLAQRPRPEFESCGDTHSVRAEIAHAGATLPSSELAADTPRVLADLSIGGRHPGRRAEAIGTELVTRGGDPAESHRTRELAPQVPDAPAAVAAEVDGGRYPRRTGGHGCGARNPQWREDEVACRATLAGRTHDRGPRPEPPECPSDRKHASRLTQCPAAREPEFAGEVVEPADRPGRVAWQPERRVGTGGVSARDRHAFGYRVAAEARARNAEAASRRAIVGDGRACDWAIQERWLAGYVPVVDVIPARGDVRQAAGATGVGDAGRRDGYTGRLRSCRRGRGSDVPGELGAEQERTGAAPGDAGATDPRVAVGRARVDGRSNVERMTHPGYRRSGLPVTRSRVGSRIKEVHYRAKGTEKFWNESGAESVPAGRAAARCDDERPAKHLAARPGSQFHRRARAV